MYRKSPESGLEVLLGHPGGPYWARKDEGAWTLPKGIVNEGEDLLAAAQREFTEETGFVASPPFLPLGEIKQKSGKLINAWAFEGDCDPRAMVSNLFELEWPPRSGRMKSFEELDRAGWFAPQEALRKVLAGQAGFIARLLEIVQQPGKQS